MLIQQHVINLPKSTDDDNDSYGNDNDDNDDDDDDDDDSIDDDDQTIIFSRGWASRQFFFLWPISWGKAERKILLNLMWIYAQFWKHVLNFSVKVKRNSARWSFL